jgi:hypothetical protein
MIIDTAFAESLLVSRVLCWSSMKNFPKVSKRHGHCDGDVRKNYIHKRGAEVILTLG